MGDEDEIALIRLEKGSNNAKLIFSLLIEEGKNL